ncbi:uncharacterized protein RB166_015485 [Leptodactylus fuscus]|uniref:uncharacterized protein LOC142216401 n=1 Tax=Leptodactylus fuscus TaxID=238119 RepID=UPI003F4F34D1
MTASRIKAEILQTSLIWVTALIIAPSHSQQIPRITNLDCLNDFDTTMVCSWEVVNGDINCSSDFQLKYRESYKKSSQYCKDLDNEYYKNFRVPNKCTCNITVIVFTLSDKYIIDVESQGQNVGNAIIDVASSVKPKTPTILNVNLSNSENGVVNWRTNYDREFTKSRLSFHIQIISMEDDKTALENDLQQMEPRYTFSKRQLSRGQDYRVRVKVKFTEAQTREIWSEWSPEFVFRNDYDLTIEERLVYIIPISCAVLLPLIVLGYFCITRTKQNWWNNIPDPARSKLAESNLSPRNYVKPAAKPDPEKSWGKCLVQLVKDSKKSKYEQFTKEHSLQDHLVGNYMTKIIFQPEVVDIEKYFDLCPRRDDTEYPEDSPEDKEEDIPLMPMDVSIGNMFCDILSDSPVMVDGLEHFNVDNAFGNFGSPILRDSGQKTLRHLPLSMVSQESGYQSYDSDDSPGDSKSDGTNPIYLDQCSLSQGDFSPYAPVSRIGESGSQMCNEDVFMSSGYNSFASALGEAVSEGDNISVFSLGRRSYKPHYHHSMKSPKSVLYYNTRSFTTCYWKDLQPTTTPTSDHGVETSTSSGYQSFNQAVQQGDTTCLVFDSGYKPFESLTSSCTSSEDDTGGLSELDNPYKHLAQNNEDLPWTGEVNAGTDLWDHTQIPGFHSTEFNFYDRKHPFVPETLGEEYKSFLHQVSDLHSGLDKTFLEVEKPLALTFDISGHLSNIQGPKMSLGSKCVGFPTNMISFPCSMYEKSITREDLLDKNGTHTDKGFPMKFENMSYFSPLYHLRAGGYGQTSSHVLIQHNNMVEEGNSYMKIAVW